MTIALIASTDTYHGSPIDTTGATLLVAVAIADSYGGLPPTVTDSKGNTWTQLTMYTTSWSGTTGACSIFYCASPAVGPGHTFSANGGHFAEWIGVLAFGGPGSSPFDSEAGGSGTNAGSVTPSQSGCVIIAGIFMGSGASMLDSGFTYVSYDNNGNFWAGGYGYLIQTSAGAVTPTWSTSGAVALAIFKPAGVAGPNVNVLIDDEDD